MDKLQKQIRELEEAHAEDLVNDHIAAHRQKDYESTLLLLGGFHAAQKISHAIGSEIMKALELFQQQKLYTNLGCQTFVEFLDTHEYSPMSKSQYYERLKVYEKEGEQIFDLLSGVGLSIRKRKLLGAGNVEIDGDKVIVHGDEVIEIDLSDRTRIFETLSALADANANKSRSIQNLKEAKTKAENKNRELYDEIDQVRASKAVASGSDAHSLALANACFGLVGLRSEAEKLNAFDRAARRDAVFEALAGPLEDLRVIYGHSQLKTPVLTPDMTDEEFMAAGIEAVFSGADFDDLDDESAAAALAAAL